MITIKKVLIFISFTLFLPLTAFAEVIVSPVMATDKLLNNYVIQAGTMQTIPLISKGTAEDSYRIKIEATNAIYKDITAYIVDQQNLYLYQAGQPFRGMGYQKAVAPFTIQGSTHTTGSKFLILDNRYAAIISKKINISIEARFPLDTAEQEKIRQSFEQLYTSLQKNLVFPNFNIRVEPCGQVNAFSESFGTGDIHYCTETISNLARSNNQGAFAAIFYHEVGHSLLGLWGIPGNNNEDIADEFATYILMSSGPSGYALLDRSLEFWQNRDSVAEAQNMLINGDRHSLSIQRVRNIKENMRQGDAFIKRWNNLIYQHYAEEALNRVIANPTYGDDVTLAESIVKQRQLAQ